jgi:predicted TIM-barrel enzyme
VEHGLGGGAVQQVFVVGLPAAVNPDVITLCHGGPIAEPQDAQYIYEHTQGISGFFGASSIERLATEPAIQAQARRFKDLKL